MTPLPRAPRPSRERGAVLLVSLLILVVMLISSVALVRSFDTSLGTAGNLAFKRDLAQKSEEAAQLILAEFRAGGDLFAPGARAANLAGWNYSAVVLPSNAQGIPEALLTSGALPTAAGTRGDITDADRNISLRFVIDRLCSDVGLDAALGRERCTVSQNTTLPGTDFVGLGGAEGGSGVAAGGTGAGVGGAVPLPVIYRLSIRATGPRNTQSFFQTNFSCCGN